MDAPATDRALGLRLFGRQASKARARTRRSFSSFAATGAAGSGVARWSPERPPSRRGPFLAQQGRYFLPRGWVPVRLRRRGLRIGSTSASTIASGAVSTGTSVTNSASDCVSPGSAGRASQRGLDRLPNPAYCRGAVLKFPHLGHARQAVPNLGKPG